MLNALNFLESTPASVDLTPITTALSSALTPGQITAIIASVLTGSLALVVLWFGARKLVKAFMSAFKSGKIKF